MKIVQINTVYKMNSTGRTCWEVEKALAKRGYDCLTLHQTGPHVNNCCDYIVNSKMGYYFHKLCSRLFGLDGYYSRFATKKAIARIIKFNPDVIHLRNLHGGYLNLKMLFEYLSKANIPIIYNLHDTWAFTGKCPEYENVQCNKWMYECNHCPQYKGYPRSWIFDHSKRMYYDKKHWYDKITNLTIVGVSDYIKEEAQKSPLFNNRRILRIYNWIDLDIFKPYLEVKKSNLGLRENFLVIGVSSYWKKNSEFEEMCELAKLLQNEAQVCLVGGESLKLPYSNMVHIPFTESKEELAKLYSIADVFVCLSTAESFGKVAAEALSCGTPIIVYDTTGIAEIPQSGCGYKVPKHSVNAVKESILKIKKIGKKQFAENCRKRAELLFAYDTNISELITLYEELMNERAI